MKTPKHTKGPWVCVPKDGSDGWTGIYKEDKEGRELLADVHLEANAHLITTAPEMLEALELALNCLENLPAKCTAERYAIEKLKAAIKKARGEL